MLFEIKNISEVFFHIRIFKWFLFILQLHIVGYIAALLQPSHSRKTAKYHHEQG